MNSMMNTSIQPQNNTGMGPSWMQNSQQSQQPWQRPQQQPVVKSLTENDISDLLS